MIDFSALNAKMAGNGQAPTPQTLGQGDFLKLMVKQLQAQDPLKPQDGTAMVSQMAQFSSVASLDKLQQSFDGFAGSYNQNQALQASALIGKEVSVTGNQGVLFSGEPFKAMIDIPASTDQVTITYRDAAGSVVHSETLGPQQAGSLPVSWNGVKDNGQTAPPGNYTVSAEARVSGQNTVLQTSIVAPVRSVNLNSSQGVEVDVAGLGKKSFSELGVITG
ncbi:MAG: hypothetical protein RIQ52_1467 [Pseudomonadota bacterium]|jgi:flagellar basal-body rod modification protein FlgD